MLGLEYAGLNETTISIETVNRRLGDYEEPFTLPLALPKKDELTMAFRYQQYFDHRKWRLVLFSQAYRKHAEGGAFHRFTVDYDVADAVRLTGGVISYIGGTHPLLGAYENNDRLFLNLRYSF